MAMVKWFRWWNGASCDPKLALIARETKTPRVSVVAVWARVLELANEGEERGVADGLPIDEIAISLDMDDAAVDAILASMRRRGMLAWIGETDGDGVAVTAWMKRQPEREREDDGASERKRQQRERDKAKQGESRPVTPGHAMSHPVTPGHALEERRGEEKRGEEKENHQVATTAPAGAGAPPTPTRVDQVEHDRDDQGSLEGQDQEPSGDEEAPPEASAAGAPPDCPHEAIVDAYHAALPAAPRVRCWGDANRAQLRARWRERAERQSVAWWRAYFEQVGESDFLTGRAAPAAGRPPFVADLAWLVRASNLEKVMNGRYLNRDHDGLSAAGRATEQAGERWAQKMRERMESEGGSAA